MDKYGIIEIKPKKDIEDDKDENKVNNDEDKFDRETQKDEDEDEENNYLENW